MNESRVGKKLHAGKQRLRAERRNLSLPEKVAQVVELQRIVLPQYRRRRALKEWEKVWKLAPSDRR